MTGQGLKAQLEKLLALIMKERECAKAFAMEELLSVTREKEALLQSLGGTEAAEPELRELAEKIQAENRRNAYLFWSALNWVRESMEFFGRQMTPAGYGAGGGLVSSGHSGSLLSGRV